MCIFDASNAQADTPLNGVLLLIAVAHKSDWLNQHSVPATLTLHSSRNRVKGRWTQSHVVCFMCLLLCLFLLFCAVGVFGIGCSICFHRIAVFFYDNPFGFIPDTVAQ